MVEQGAVPAGVRIRTSCSRWRRTPPGHTRVPCEELADGVGAKGEIPGESLPKARTGRRQTRRWSAERRRALATVRAHKEWRANRCSIPSILRRGTEKGRRPTRGRKEYGRICLPWREPGKPGARTHDRLLDLPAIGSEFS